MKNDFGPNTNVRSLTRNNNFGPNTDITRQTCEDKRGLNVRIHLGTSFVDLNGTERG